VRVFFERGDEQGGNTDVGVFWRNRRVTAKGRHGEVQVELAFLGDCRETERAPPLLGDAGPFIDEE
jgi:hypothetical protein